MLFASRFLALAVAAALSCLSFAAQAGAPEATTAVKPSQGGAETAARLALAKELLALTNMSEAPEGWKRNLLEPAFRPQCQCGTNAEMQAKITAGWTKAVNESFDSAEMLSSLEAMTAEALTRSELETLVAAHKSPLGLKVQAAELDHRKRTRERNPIADAQYVKALAARIAKEPKRRALLQRLIDEQGGAKMMADSIVNISIGAALGASALTPRDRPRPDDTEIVAMIEGLRPRIEAQIAGIVLPYFTDVYAPLSNAELDTYVQKVSEPLERKLTTLVLNGFNRHLRVQAIKVGRQLATELNAQGI